jgi:acyl-CoA hydrolase
MLLSGEPDRAVIKQGLAQGRKYISYVPCNLSQIPRALTEHMRVNSFVVTVSPMDASGHFSLGTNNEYASTVIRNCDWPIIARHENMISVNTAIEVDLYGQVNTEFINRHQYSGSGGQFDFVKGASLSKGGKSFYRTEVGGKGRKNILRCTSSADGHGHRMDVEYIVTEHGMVSASRNPNFRDELTQYAKSINLI